MTLYKPSAATVAEVVGHAHTLQSALRPVWPEARLHGPAYAVRGVPGDNLALHRAVAHAPPGSVIAADVGGAPYGHWGEVLAVAAQTRGITGLLIDGSVRDVDELEALRFPVVARGIALSGTTKRHPGHGGATAVVGGRLVRSGDLVVADRDGCVVVPAADLAAVLHRARERDVAEQEVLTRIRAGETTLQIYGLPA